MSPIRELRLAGRGTTENTAKPAAAVVVGGTLNGLGVVRSLAAGRMPIYLLERSRSCAAGWSRHARLVKASRLDGPELIRTLVELRARLPQAPILILTDDPSVEIISSHRREIEPLYRISLPSADMVHSLADKSAFQAFADTHGFPVPRGFAIHCESDVARLRDLTHPVVIKPADKALVLAGAVERAVRANTLSESRAEAKRMLGPARHLVVQEWIEGPDSEIFFTLFSCDRRSKVIGLFCGRKIVSSPPQTGSTAICVAAPEAFDKLADETRRFIEAVQYRGLGSLEFKRDTRTGRFAIIEPTVGRTDWQEEIATLCGVNLPLLTYRAELGVAESTLSPSEDSVSPSCSSSSVAWRASLENEAPRTLSLRGVRLIDGYFRWSDPLPAVYHYLYARGALRLLRRIRAVAHR